MTASDAQPYLDLAERFIAKTLDADTFQTRLIAAFGDDDIDRPSSVARLIERFVIDADDYVDDPELRDPDHGDLDAEQLTALTRRFLDELLTR